MNLSQCVVVNLHSKPFLDIILRKSPRDQKFQCLCQFALGLMIAPWNLKIITLSTLAHNWNFFGKAKEKEDLREHLQCLGSTQNGWFSVKPEQVRLGLQDQLFDFINLSLSTWVRLSTVDPRSEVKNGPIFLDFVSSTIETFIVCRTWIEQPYIVNAVKQKTTGR